MADLHKLSPNVVLHRLPKMKKGNPSKLVNAVTSTKGVTKVCALDGATNYDPPVPADLG